MKDLGTFFLVGSGGFLGANARYWLGAWLRPRVGETFPWHTLIINVSGSFVMGLFMGLVLANNWSSNWRAFIAIGVLGGYTTYSAFSYEAVNLLSERLYLSALWYIAGSAVLSVLGAWLGMAIARALLGNPA